MIISRHKHGMYHLSPAEIVIVLDTVTSVGQCSKYAEATSLGYTVVSVCIMICICTKIRNCAEEHLDMK